MNAFEYFANKAQEFLAPRLEQLLQAQFELAIGVKTADGYVKPPDARAGQYLIDRVCGKPKETSSIEVSVVQKFIVGLLKEVESAIDAVVDRYQADQIKSRINSYLAQYSESGEIGDYGTQESNDTNNAGQNGHAVASTTETDYSSD